MRRDQLREANEALDALDRLNWFEERFLAASVDNLMLSTGHPTNPAAQDSRTIYVWISVKAVHAELTALLAAHRKNLEDTLETMGVEL